MKAIRIIYLFVGFLLFCYIAFSCFYFKGKQQKRECTALQIVVKDSLEKHFVTEKELYSQLKQAKLNPIDKQMYEINTEEIEKVLLKNEMIARVQAYKTPSGIIKLEVQQKMPIMRIHSQKGNYYLDHAGSTMPISSRYVAHVPVVTGYVEKEFATSTLYDFALFLLKDEFWNNQIEQIYVSPNQEVELIPRVGNHKIILGTFDDYIEKLTNLELFYKQAIPKVGWNKYSTINLKYRNQIVCTKK